MSHGAVGSGVVKAPAVITRVVLQASCYKTSRRKADLFENRLAHVILLPFEQLASIFFAIFGIY